MELRSDISNVSWYVNGVLVGKGRKTYDFPAGKRYTVRCVSDQGASEIRISVGENPISSRMEQSNPFVTGTMTPSR